jgi:Domain of unknown function (DUF4123)/FHA domain
VKAALHVASGRLAGRRVPLAAGKALRVGRGARADVAVSQDEKMAAVHFELSWDGAACRVRDVGKVGTRLDGEAVGEGGREVRDGGWLVAGETGFLLRVRGDDLRAGLPPPPMRWKPATAELRAAREKALGALRGEAGLYAILDAARDARIKALVDVCEEEARSLFDGREGEALVEVAPYLVRFGERSELLEVVVNEGWGDAWGVFLTSGRPFDEVRRRLRRSLMVNDEETGKRLYFRFYDPRVLRLFLPACTARQRSELTGMEIERFLVEGLEAEPVRLGGAAC